MLFLDSSIWLAHLVEASEKASNIVESNFLLFCSILTLFEVKKKLLKSGINDEKIKK